MKFEWAMRKCLIRRNSKVWYMNHPRYNMRANRKVIGNPKFRYTTSWGVGYWRLE